MDCDRERPHPVPLPQAGEGERPFSRVREKVDAKRPDEGLGQLSAKARA
jgi:hypothetical protein